MCIRDRDTTGTSSGGYNTPADIDGNSVADYTEAGPNNASSETQTACDSLVWNGTTYTTSGTYTFTTTNMSGCDSVVTLTLTITPSETATFSYNNTNYCTIGSDPTPTITGTTGGVFSATPTGLTISASTGAIDLDASTAGTYTVQYITSTSTCADTATASITLEMCTDTDGDGIPDITDLDDDNDGILDSDEGCSSYGSTNITGVTQEGPSANQTGTNWLNQTLPQQGSNGWLSIDESVSFGERITFNTDFITDLIETAGSPKYEWYMGLKDANWSTSGNFGYPNDLWEGGVYIKLTYSQATIYVTLYGGNYTHSAAINSAAVASSNTRFFFEIASDGNSIRAGFSQLSSGDVLASTAYANWSNKKVTSLDTNLGLTGSIDFMMFVQAASNNAPAIDIADIDWTKIQLINFCPDSDGDGIPNHLDLDSDNDGIADIVEAGGTDADGNGLVDTFTDTDNDGLHDPYDADNGGTTVVPTDTDTDGVADYLDLDADNDGIYDLSLIHISEPTRPY